MDPFAISKMLESTVPIQKDGRHHPPADDSPSRRRKRPPSDLEMLDEDDKESPDSQSAHQLDELA
jgi:hypothetical protein